MSHTNYPGDGCRLSAPFSRFATESLSSLPSQNVIPGAAVLGRLPFVDDESAAL